MLPQDLICSRLILGIAVALPVEVWQGSLLADPVQVELEQVLALEVVAVVELADLELQSYAWVAIVVMGLAIELGLELGWVLDSNLQVVSALLKRNVI